MINMHLSLQLLIRYRTHKNVSWTPCHPIPLLFRCKIRCHHQTQCPRDSVTNSKFHDSSGQTTISNTDAAQTSHYGVVPLDKFGPIPYNFFDVTGKRANRLVWRNDHHSCDRGVENECHRNCGSGGTSITGRSGKPTFCL